MYYDTNELHSDMHWPDKGAHFITNWSDDIMQGLFFVVKTEKERHEDFY
jgi:hypothetical protein